jgi:Protein of unknown function (DUF2975)
MKNISILFLQFFIIFISIVVLGLLIWFPLTEGRATNLDIFSIYSDPFILYGYFTSIAFFVGLFNVFKILGYIRKNNFISLKSTISFKIIKYCTFIFGALIVGAGLYIKQFHDKNDDPAGFLAMCLFLTFLTAVIATATIVIEKKLQNAIEMKSENDPTV